MPPGPWATALKPRHPPGVWPFSATAGPRDTGSPWKMRSRRDSRAFSRPMDTGLGRKMRPNRVSGPDPRPAEARSGAGGQAAPPPPTQGETVHLGKKIAIALLLLPLAELVG